LDGYFSLGFCQILLQASLLGYPSNFTIYDSQGFPRAISGIIKEMQLDRDVYKPKQVLSKFQF
jgi:DNA helicase-2/ATP-dependent DNA helicase PcrA